MYVWRRYFIFVCCFFLPAMEQQVLLPNCRLPGFSLSLSKLIFSLYHHFLRPFGRPPRIRHEMPLLIRLKIRPFEIARSILFEFLLRSRLAPLPKERTKIFFCLTFFFFSISFSLVVPLSFSFYWWASSSALDLPHTIPWSRSRHKNPQNRKVRSRRRESWPFALEPQRREKKRTIVLWLFSAI